MEGYASLFDGHLSTVWSAPNYCYRCGNSASILEVGPGESLYFNVFEAAPENDRDGPSQQAAQNMSGKVSSKHFCMRRLLIFVTNAATRVFFIIVL
jgi:serine/threonine-protein phosphatase PPG1